MVDLAFTRAGKRDAQELFAQMRPADRAETTAASGPDVEATLRAAIGASTYPLACRRADGRLLCMFGVVPLGMLRIYGSPWMLGTPLVATRKRSLVALTRRYFDEMLTEFTLLVNYADARNTASLRLIGAIGCAIDPPAPYGVEGLPFHRFYKGAGHV